MAGVRGCRTHPGLRRSPSGFEVPTGTSRRVPARPLSNLRVGEMGAFSADPSYLILSRGDRIDAKLTPTAKWIAGGVGAPKVVCWGTKRTVNRSLRPGATRRFRPAGAGRAPSTAKLSRGAGVSARLARGRSLRTVPGRLRGMVRGLRPGRSQRDDVLEARPVRPAPVGVFRRWVPPAAGRRRGAWRRGPRPRVRRCPPCGTRIAIVGLEGVRGENLAAREVVDLPPSSTHRVSPSDQTPQGVSVARVQFGLVMASGH